MILNVWEAVDVKVWEVANWVLVIGDGQRGERSCEGYGSVDRVVGDSVVWRFPRAASGSYRAVRRDHLFAGCGALVSLGLCGFFREG